MDRIIYTFDQTKEPDKGSAHAQKYGYLEFLVRSDKAKNLEQTRIRAIRSFDSALIFEGNTNASGRLKIALPVSAHKTTEKYTITVNYNSFPTKTLSNVSVTAGQTTSQTIQIG